MSDATAPQSSSSIDQDEAPLSKKEAEKAPARESSSKKTPATLRSTGGAGFEFEDLISGWLMLKMLLGEPLPAIGGQGHTLQAQISPLGWRIDDLLVTATEGARTRRLAISIKGNVQVTRAGLPADFVTRAWEQWRETDSGMKRNDDALALVIRSGPVPAFHPHWNEIKDASLSPNPELGLARIRANTNQSRIFDSVRKATGGGAAATDDETLDLIRHLHVLPVDFQLAHSERQAEAIGLCRRLLVSGDLAEAGEFWKKLVQVASRVRLRKGTISLAELWGTLREDFALLNHPNFAADWQTLANITEDVKARVQTELPSGYAIQRLGVAEKLEIAIRQNPITVIFAESGAGKSSLVKVVLDQRFGDRNQVWFGPDELRAALSAVRRSNLPLRKDLLSVLIASNFPQNILVLDSVERIDPVELPVLKGLLDKLLDGDDTWRVVIISQTQSWGERSQSLLGVRVAQLVELEALSAAEVKIALSHTPALTWLGAHGQTLAALTNLRTLGWVVQAGPAFGAGESELSSHTAVADRLWRYWTKDAVDLQALMMRLAEREAAFERNFALSEFDPGDLSILRKKPQELPLRVDLTSNRVQFEHDLAADWSRYQFLKQYVSNTAKWAELAANPLWSVALRMLGQHLLRLPDGKATAWDRALVEAEATKLPLAADVLLDALALDSDAENLLRTRTDMLFRDNGKRLNRLLARFHYLGTVPRGPAGELSKDSGMAVYLDARFRSLVSGRWPPIARFLIEHQNQIAPILSAPVANLIQTWLTSVPITFRDGTSVPFRREFSELALASVRAAQIEKAQGTIFLTREPALYGAALAGAADLPDEVAHWALEMAGRRDTPEDVKAAIAGACRKRAEERAERLSKDSASREAGQRRRQILPTIFSSRESLPPWPLGASYKVDDDFRQACLKDQGLRPLMHARPEVAAEVLLALIVDDEPYEEYGSSRLEFDLGLDYAHDAYPTAFWKSPFFSFLQAAPQVALAAIIDLVNFCTERWVAAYGAPELLLDLPGVGTSKFVGARDVFDWTQENSHHHGNLHCALDAVERWLVLRVEAEENIEADITRLINGCPSVAILGLLANVGKFKPELFKGPLRFLLTHPALYRWDERRVDLVGRFDSFSWIRGGELMFDIAKAWVLAPHRKRKMSDIAIDLLKSEGAVATCIKEAMEGWKLPDDPKRALEQRILMASLDFDNYQKVVDSETSTSTLTLVYPDDVRTDVESWKGEHSKALELLNLPYSCEKVLASFSEITDESAEYLHGLIETAANQNLDRDFIDRSIIAAAATLASCSESWLNSRPQARDKIFSIIRGTVEAVADEFSEVRSERIGVPNDNLKFAAFAVMYQWLKGGEEAANWEPLLLRLLTGGSGAACGVIMNLAHARREQLGSAWWRLNQVMLLYSALSMLGPSYNDPEETDARWSRWLAKLRNFPLLKPGATWTTLDFGRVVKALQRLERRRRERMFVEGGPSWRMPLRPDERPFSSLDTRVLEWGLNWLIEGSGSGDLATDRALALKLWDVEADRQREYGDKDGKYGLPSQNLGYNLMHKLAALAITSPEMPSIWESVLGHGPKAHHAVRRFIAGLFEKLGRDPDPQRSKAIWRAIATYGLERNWGERNRHWFYWERILGDLLGFGSEGSLARMGTGTVIEMRDLYQRWARDHLAVDEENLTRFATFLTSRLGSPLRLEGLPWIATVSKKKRDFQTWGRESTTNALVELLNVTLNEDSAGLRSDAAARTAVIAIAAGLAALVDPTAMALQERIKLLQQSG